jgi:hypothetical protein
MKILFTFGILLVFAYCQQPAKETVFVAVHAGLEPAKNQEQNPKNTLESRFAPPKGFLRAQANPASFAYFLRSLPLKSEGSPVLYFNGKEKYNNNVYAAVVDLPIGNKNLHQCADAVMRLRADYFYQQKRYEAIHFNFTNGFRVDYKNWMDGQRIVVQGNKTSWAKKTAPSNTPDTYWAYLETIFMYAGTLSLAQELKPTPIQNLAIGDVFIYGGSPGHAVIVVDKAINAATNTYVFMLAQSYMPAQEIQILVNSDHPATVWYEMPKTAQLITPEWTFESSALKKFDDH